MPTRILCATVVLSALAHASAWGAAFVVNDLADAVDAAPGNGACATARGTCTLRAAVQETNALAGADQITLAAGVHELSIPGAHEDAAATGDLDITDDLTIAGANAYLSVIDANGIDRVIDQLAPAAPLDLSLRDLTISGGDTDDNGGGVRYNSTLDAERIIVTRNVTATNGGGIGAGGTASFDEPALTLSDSIVSLNEALSGAGGIESGNAAGFLVERSIVIANTAGNSGGGLRLSDNGDEFGRLDQVTVYGNNVLLSTAQPEAGGVRSSEMLILDRSWIGHNLVGSWGAPAPIEFGVGGGLFIGGDDDDASVITNTTIEGNLAGAGGAIANNADVTITHATIARNGAEAESGGLDQFSDVMRLENTIVAENEPQNCADAPISLGHNLADDDSCNLAAGGDNEDVDPQLGILGYYGGLTQTIPPLLDSVAIEGGTDANIDVDQRGVARPQLAQFDIGAMEMQARRARQRYTGGFTSNPHPCDLDRNGRVDFADLDRLIASFPVAGGSFRGNADQRLKQCVASCTHAGCPAVALIKKKPGRRS